MSSFYYNPNTRWSSSSLLSTFDNLNWIKENQNNQNALTMKKKPKHSVKFAEVCRVVLVPKREEYTAAGIQLWWTTVEFHQFKKERYLELTQQNTVKEDSSTTSSTSSTSTSPTSTTTSSSSTTPSEVSSLKSIPCFEIQLRILICTPRSPSKCNYLTNLSKYLWSEDNPNRFETYLSIHYTTPSQLSTILSDHTTSSQCNIIILDKSTGHYHGTENITCQIIRQFVKLAIIISILESEAAIQSNDDFSFEQADLLLAASQIPSTKQWKELIELLIERLECRDFLPSPLVQHYITAI